MKVSSLITVGYLHIPSIVNVRVNVFCIYIFIVCKVLILVYCFVISYKKNDPR